MAKKEESLLKIYTEALKVKIASRVRGDIKEILFREIDSTYDSINKLVEEAKKEAKEQKKNDTTDKK